MLSLNGTQEYKRMRAGQSCVSNETKHLLIAKLEISAEKSQAITVTIILFS